MSPHKCIKEIIYAEHSEILLEPLKLTQTLLLVLEALVMLTPDKVKSEQGVSTEQLMLIIGFPLEETELNR